MVVPVVEPAAVVPIVEPEPDTLFVSCSGLVTDPSPEPEPGRDDPALQPEPPTTAEAVVPEQGVNPAPVVPRQHVVPNTEFRKRYLRTFEAARRRSNH
jgi:hypothetical protein